MEVGTKGRGQGRVQGSHPCDSAMSCRGAPRKVMGSFPGPNATRITARTGVLGRGAWCEAQGWVGPGAEAWGGTLAPCTLTAGKTLGGARGAAEGEKPGKVRLEARVAGGCAAAADTVPIEPAAVPAVPA